MQDGQIELRAVHREDHVERIGIFAAPQRILDVRDLAPLGRVGIDAGKDRAVVFPQVVHHHEELAVGREADLVTRRMDLVEDDLPRVLVDLLDLVLVLRILVELQEGGRLEILLGVEDADATAQAHDGGGPAAFRMPDRAVGPGERQRRLAGQRAFLDEQLAHRHHFPIDLVALGAAQIVEAGLLVRVDLLDGERAALDPCIA